MTPPRLSISQISTFRQPFDDDLRTYAAAGVEGIGIWELKLPDRADRETLRLVRESGLAVTNCVPAVPSVLPMPGFEEPAEPEERVERLLAGLRRLAAFEPEAVVFLTGAPGNRAALLEGIRAVAAEGQRLGVPVGLEPLQPRFHADSTHVTSVAQALALLEEAGASSAGVTFDTWHLWGDEGLRAALAASVDRVVAVHVAGWREPTRSWADRVLPGEGSNDVAALVAALEAAGWRGFYDVELFSDDGVFGDDFEDSLWKLDGGELARRVRADFDRVWRRAARAA